MAKGKLRTAHTYQAPAVIAVVCFAGLILGLFGDGPVDVLSWLLTGAVVSLCLWCLIKQ